MENFKEWPSSHFQVDYKGCWIWKGRINSRGYAIFDFSNNLVHRKCYTEFNGLIPNDYHIHHTCRTRNCINPSHLEALSLSEHSSKRRLPFCKRGHPLVGENRGQKGRCVICAQKIEKRDRRCPGLVKEVG